jgi:hypothetical protein
VLSAGRFSPLGSRGICGLYSGRRRRLPFLSTKKYFKTKRPLRPCSGPPQLRHVSSLSLESGPPSACTRWYNASQFGQLNGVEGFVVIRPKFYACLDKTQGHGNETFAKPVCSGHRSASTAIYTLSLRQSGSKTSAVGTGDTMPIPSDASMCDTPQAEHSKV